MFLFSGKKNFQKLLTKMLYISLSFSLIFTFYSLHLCICFLMCGMVLLKCIFVDDIGVIFRIHSRHCCGGVLFFTVFDWLVGLLMFWRLEDLPAINFSVLYINVYIKKFWWLLCLLVFKNWYGEWDLLVQLFLHI